MRRYILPAILVIILALAGIGLYRWHKAATSLAVPHADYSQAGGTPTILASGAASDPVVAAAWQTFEQYLAAAKAHDTKTLASLSYKLSSACATAPTGSDCTGAMDRVSSIGAGFKERDFTHAAYDSRQIIISTDWHLEENDAQIGYGREAIYFVRDASGAAHVLFFTQPEEIIYSFIDPSETHGALVSRLNERIADSDGDYLEDEYETCSYEGAASSTPACIPTDPHKMDTDSNGWWDSIEQDIK